MRLVMLWGWTIHHREDGDLAGLTPEMIARVAGWSGDPGLFLQALRGSGWMDGDQVHDWLDHQGSLVRKRVKDRLRRRTERGSVPTTTPLFAATPVHATPPKIGTGRNVATTVPATAPPTVPPTQANVAATDPDVADPFPSSPAVTTPFPSSPSVEADLTDDERQEKFNAFNVLLSAFPHDKRGNIDAAMPFWMGADFGTLTCSEALKRSSRCLLSAKKSKKWKEKGGQFQPSFANWLKARPWDQPEPEKSKPEATDVRPPAKMRCTECDGRGCRTCKKTGVNQSKVISAEAMREITPNWLKSKRPEDDPKF